MNQKCPDNRLNPFNFPDDKGQVAFVILGASGDLAKKKTFPALSHLFFNQLIPKNIIIVGYSRTKLNREGFHNYVFSEKIKTPNEFFSRVWYLSGNYDDENDLKKLSNLIEEVSDKNESQKNLIFYMALPPTVFDSTAEAISKYCTSKTGWNRIIIEKPFGLDLESSNMINTLLSRLYYEDQLFRIDHYLGKEMVQNLMSLRFANTIFEPIWNSLYISSIQITFKEDFGTEGRAGYFDRFGIIRDIMQNHLIQIFALIAMEPPVSLSSEDIRDEKVKVLRSVSIPDLEKLIIGQYTRNGNYPGYIEESGVPEDSVTPTFATLVLTIKNARWNGVPFILKCGKGLNERKAEIRIQFRNTGNYLYTSTFPNELVCIIQPNEAVYLKMMSKIPGLTNELIQSELDLSYKSRFYSRTIPDAYERLLFDVIKGDRSLFVRADELEASWRIFTPILKKLDSQKVKPVKYLFGTRGPIESDELTAKYGWKYNDKYKWNPNY